MSPFCKRADYTIQHITYEEARHHQKPTGTTLSAQQDSAAQKVKKYFHASFASSQPHSTKSSTATGPFCPFHANYDAPPAYRQHAYEPQKDKADIITSKAGDTTPISQPHPSSSLRRMKGRSNLRASYPTIPRPDSTTLLLSDPVTISPRPSRFREHLHVQDTQQHVGQLQDKKSNMKLDPYQQLFSREARRPPRPPDPPPIIPARKSSRVAGQSIERGHAKTKHKFKVFESHTRPRKFSDKLAQEADKFASYRHQQSHDSTLSFACCGIGQYEENVRHEKGVNNLTSPLTQNRSLMGQIINGNQQHAHHKTLGKKTYLPRGHDDREMEEYPLLKPFSHKPPVPTKKQSLKQTVEDVGHGLGEFPSDYLEVPPTPPPKDPGYVPRTRERKR